MLSRACLGHRNRFVGNRSFRVHNFLPQGPQGTAAFKRQRNAIYSFPQRIGSDRAVGSRVLPACVSLRNTLRWQSQEAARIYVAESSLLRIATGLTPLRRFYIEPYFRT
jgi:spore cortex formation protein SpoVR/YcgB (stage V sporulation)